MDALEHEPFANVVAVDERQQPRPEVVVLALLERGVVPERMHLERLAVDEDRRMEEGGAEERVPPHRHGAGGHDMRAAPHAMLVEVRYGRAHDRGPRGGPAAVGL